MYPPIYNKAFAVDFVISSFGISYPFCSKAVWESAVVAGVVMEIDRSRGKAKRNDSSNGGGGDWRKIVLLLALWLSQGQAAQSPHLDHCHSMRLQLQMRLSRNAPYTQPPSHLDRSIARPSHIFLAHSAQAIFLRTLRRRSPGGWLTDPQPQSTPRTPKSQTTNDTRQQPRRQAAALPCWRAAEAVGGHFARRGSAVAAGGEQRRSQ